MESVRRLLPNRNTNNNNDTGSRRKKVGFSKRKLKSYVRSSHHSSSFYSGSSSRRFIPRRSVAAQSSNVGSSLSHLGDDEYNDNAGVDGKSFMTSLESRLAETKVYILHQDGGREYKDMTLRDLYTYVMSAIKERPPTNLTRSISASTNANQSLSTIHSHATSESNTSFKNLASPTPYPRGKVAMSSLQGSNKALPSSFKSPTDSAILPPPPPLSLDLAQQEQQQQQHMRHTSSMSTLNASNLTIDQTNTATTPSSSTFTPADYKQSKKERKMTIVDDTELPPPPPPQTSQKSLLTPLPSLPPKPPIAPHLDRTASTRTTAANTNTGGGGEKESITAAQITYRERLGGYLHPRDMRRLVTPFSTSNEPELIVRRHVMLLNFDPLRATVLRDRLLVVVPDGADTILEDLEKRLRGGIVELENSVFGDDGGGGADNEEEEENKDGDGEKKEVEENGDGDVVMKVEDVENVVDVTSGAAYVAVVSPWDNAKENASDGAAAPPPPNTDSTEKDPKLVFGAGDKKDGSGGDGGGGGGDDGKKDGSTTENDNDDDDENDDYDDSSENTNSTATTMNPIDFENDFENEWEDFENRNWIDMPFELQSVDAVITSVTSMLHQDVRELTINCHCEMDFIRRQGEHAPEKLRELKDFVNALQRRVQGFVRAVNLILDDDEDMALMNLSRLITHPERFIQPVSEEIIHEESDEPELILEGHLQQALNTVNSLELLKGQIESTEQAVNMNLDGIRNKLLFINTLVSVASLCTAVASLVGSIFGMNLVNHLEDDTDAFVKVVVGTLVGMFVLFILLLLMFYQASTMKKLDVSTTTYLVDMHKKYN